MTGKMIKIESDASGKLRAVDMPETKLDAIPELGIEYGVAAEFVAKGVTFARGQIAPGVEVPGHAGPNLYGLYVISGTGMLTLTDADGAVESEVSYSPDDLIIFEPGAMHGWKNTGSETMRWLGVDIA